MPVITAGSPAAVAAALALAASATGPTAGGAGAPPTVLITGATRGIGLEFARQYGALGWRVIASCRDARGALELQAVAREHPNIHVEQMDITRDDEVAALADKYRGQAIDLLINNAAFLGPRGRQLLGNLDWDLFEATYEVNAVGPVRVTRAFADHVAASRGKRVLTLASAAGSIASLNGTPVQYYPYRASKAALNLLMRGLALDLAPRGIVVVLVNPGLVDTRGVMALKPGEPVPDEFAGIMPLIQSGAVKLITPQASVRAMIGLVARVTPAEAGTFINYDGKPLPW